MKDRIICYLRNKNAQLLLKNITNFSIFQFINYLIPLIAFPYVIHIIGAEYFGIISLAFATIYYLQLIVDYGFDISGVKYVAQNQKSSEILSNIFSSIITIKIVLVFCCMMILLILQYLISVINKNFIVYAFTFIMIPAMSMQCVWFYTGMEKVIYMNYINIIARGIFLLCIFLFIKSPSDYIFFPLINSVSVLISGTVSIYFLIKVFKIRFHLVSYKDIKYYFKDAWPIFISNIGINFYRNSNVIILSIFTSNHIVGIYSAGEKIVKLIQSALSPITTAAYPMISRMRLENLRGSYRVIKLLLIMMSIITSIIVVFLFSFSEFIVINFLGSEFTRSIYVIQISSFVILFGSLNYILGIIFMLNFSLKKQFTISVLSTGILNLLLCSILSQSYLEKGAAYAFSFSETFLLINLIFYIILNKKKWYVANNY